MSATDSLCALGLAHSDDCPLLTLHYLQEVVVSATDSLGAPEAAASGLGLGAFFARQPTSGGSSSRAEVYALKVRLVVV